jgi:predicted hydrocarbon binding protein
MSEKLNRAPAHLPDAGLRLALEDTVGPDAAARALQQAGHEAGNAIFAILSGGATHEGVSEDSTIADGLGTIEEAAFWQRLSDLCVERGWGQIRFEEVHPGIGALESADWAEADPMAAALRPSCHFTVGLIANLLGRVAGNEVGVLETECRSRGDLNCRFLFGGRHALDQLYTGISAGDTVTDLIADLR